MPNKKERQAVFDKSKGRCWYCGCELQKSWHIDHAEPVGRYQDIEVTDSGPKSIQRMRKPELDVFDNWVPACKKCNLFKGGFNVEGLRKEIESQIERARRYSVNFRTAERFGLIAVNDEPVVFWFESNASTGEE